ncbi:hypothetical protein PHYBOEH_000205 [Phytophthora boehmeriae]|uniref:Uncharacterized protein n=1 Tax=Phytophthora boehmeriae TaxID=109152 RepID=A0A8T1VCJ4_9STRA|nr:hypothetical protein PHYBOEH_000205 [Phytophthora boehmeriae]
MVVDPIMSLLLWDVELPRSRRVSQLRQYHTQILDNILGAPGQHEALPSRAINDILADIVPADEQPSGGTVRTWIEEATGVERQFPQQHAVDFVYVTEAAARHIPQALRAEIGSTFCRPHEPSQAAADSSPDDVTSQSESFFADDVIDAAANVVGIDAQPARPAGTLRNSPTPSCAVQARIIRALANQLELLAEYLDSLAGGAEPPAKRRRTDMISAGGDHDRPSKFIFQPSARQSQLHQLLTDPQHAGKCATDFVDSLISHAAVQFAPHPGVLIRLFDFQFGTRGLSIMHMAFMNRVDKMALVQARHTNMQNFSQGVTLPAPRVVSCPADIVAALSSLNAYCAYFASSDVVELVQRLHTFTMEEVGTGAWADTDLPHFVYWVDNILEEFRSAAVRDISGGNSRQAVART